MSTVHPFYSQNNGVVAISHAGDTSGGAAAGSLAAYRAAHALGYRYFQIDVVLVGGGELVSAHAIVGRKRSWEDRSVDELRAAGETLDRVEDILTAIPDGRWNLEIKSRVAEPALTELLRRQLHRNRRFGVSAPFNRRILERLRSEFGDELCTNASLLEGSLVGLPLLPLREQHADAMQVFFPLVRVQRVIQRNRTNGIQFQAWPVNRRSEMERLLDLGVRGIITDDHRTLRDLLIERDQWVTS